MTISPALAAVALYAGLNALILGWLSAHVGRVRGRLKIYMGDQGHPLMIRAMRGQANFVEYVPMALILLLVTALMGAPAIAVHALGGALVIGRVLHALHFTAADAPAWQRGVGAALTIFVVMAAGIGAIAHSLFALY